MRVSGSDSYALLSCYSSTFCEHIHIIYFTFVNFECAEFVPVFTLHTRKNCCNTVTSYNSEKMADCSSGGGGSSGTDSGSMPSIVYHVYQT